MAGSTDALVVMLYAAKHAGRKPYACMAELLTARGMKSEQRTRTGER